MVPSAERHTLVSESGCTWIDLAVWKVGAFNGHRICTRTFKSPGSQCTLVSNVVVALFCMLLLYFACCLLY
jgi:hypothetical protein